MHLLTETRVHSPERGGCVRGSDGNRSELHRTAGATGACAHGQVSQSLAAVYAASGARNVRASNVLAAAPGAERNAMIRKWCESVWTAWKDARDELLNCVSKNWE